MRADRTLMAVAGLGLALALGACGDDGPKDRRVASGVEGSGEKQLLADTVFRDTAKGLGADPAGQDAEALGREIGRRMHAIVTDTGRIDPAAFSNPYRRQLERRGKLSRAAFTRRYHAGPLEMADRVGRMAGLIEAKIDEGADPEPELPRAVLAGYGHVLRDAPPQPAQVAATVRDRIVGLFPEADPRLQCATTFRSSYVFTVGVYDDR